MKNDVFVKVNYKTLGELKSTIIDKQNLFDINNNKYMMCAGKYTKEGWSLVFKASSIEEAEEILASSKFNKRNVVEPVINTHNFIEDKVSLPSWI